ncbi:hypothetical protein BD310DRAFT_921138 [Dichomitus squalens]|uniref:Uncharacterized protein n=1 Tax=Dichomitus squalens TaxID=114155 RepID=A0A4Q9Q2E8_9APHY|nr:hypothetical protein BD310DRAFT_921138 [Dichomitus squalens]
MRMGGVQSFAKGACTGRNAVCIVIVLAWLPGLPDLYAMQIHFMSWHSSRGAIEPQVTT